MKKSHLPPFRESHEGGEITLDTSSRDHQQEGTSHTVSPQRYYMGTLALLPPTMFTYRAVLKNKNLEMPTGDYLCLQAPEKQTLEKCQHLTVINSTNCSLVHHVKSTYAMRFMVSLLLFTPKEGKCQFGGVSSIYSPI